MFQILKKESLNANTTRMILSAPLIAKKAQTGQFVMIRAHEKGERIPLTIAGYDKENGTITIIFQVLGKSTSYLNSLNEGDSILDVAGPLGSPSELDGYKKAAVVGGGLGCAIAYPQAKHLFELGASVDVIAGFRNKDLIILENEMKSCSDNLCICTDDGSAGKKGFVTDALKEFIDNGANYDLVVAIGPPVMMKFVSRLTESYGIKTIVSLNPIMVDGTGMCGCCRVTVGGETRFACVDGPDFDGHKVDFDELISRLANYEPEDNLSGDNQHNCKIGLEK